MLYNMFVCGVLVYMYMHGGRTHEIFMWLVMVAPRAFDAASVTRGVPQEDLFDYIHVAYDCLCLSNEAVV